MEFARNVLVALCLLATVASATDARSGVSLKVAARNVLRRGAQERVELIARSMHVVQVANGLPQNVTKAQKEKIVDTLEDQVKNLEGNVKAIAKLEKSRKEQDRSKDLKEHLKPTDAKMMEKMDE